ncbi:uncharacterized protein N7483_011730 [Penicillium malachiteum]|uniref:uncharacterized protein n=1 Tax=Penicillium malachiteum TaxID=1324776 RepID=UPI002548469A|nr:uncharacterized protein N7483_011730 [Penicillium malachiteum]KAJ5714549.1 hypothetical protein N7483_011730 [Penicillium malachiteum]
MEDIDFSIDETDPDVTTEWKTLVGKFSDLNVHKILQKYLETCQTDIEALANACKQIEDIISWPDLKKQKKKDRAEHEHHMFFDVLLDLVQKIPYSHPAHGYLVILLKVQFPTKLGCMSYNISDDGHGTLCGPESQKEIDSYINMCSFLARLSAAGEEYFSLAIWNFRQNLEYDRSDNTSEHFGGDLAGCIMWIFYAGQWLFQKVAHCHAVLDSHDEQTWECGPLYTGPVLGLARWRF